MYARLLGNESKGAYSAPKCISRTCRISGYLPLKALMHSINARLHISAISRNEPCLKFFKRHPI